MGKLVLVVDDDPDVRLFNTTVLEENGYLPREATNGEEALDSIRGERPDLVLLDVLMPRQSGVRLYRTLRTDPAFHGIKVIVLSGIARKSFLKSQQALAEFGGDPVPEPDAYLEKPVEAEALAAAVKRAIG
jgi:twitching motility two-component system response regulator PilH